MQKILPTSELKSFLSKLSEKYDLIAPIKETNTKFQLIKDNKDLDKIYLDTITQVPFKKFFIPDNETLIETKNNKSKETIQQIKPRILFGARLCDINALQVLDKVMLDPLYLTKRKNTIIIGLYCDNPDNYCFCNSMNLNDSGYDLFFYKKGNYYYITIGTKKGEKLVKDFKDVRKILKDYRPKLKNTKSLPNLDIADNYKNNIWETDAAKCLSCSACTVYCPTCNCFDIKDKLNINLKDSKRTRHETSCQLKSFTRVAGGKSYRNSRLSRFKHFVYHKIVYFNIQHKRYMCVGCGRCLRVCPTKIDWTTTINLLKDTKKLKKK